MGKLKITGIIFGVFILILLGIAITTELQQDNSQQTLDDSSFIQTAQSKDGVEYEINDPVIISGMSYTVKDVAVRDSLPGAGFWNTSADASILYVKIKVTNISKDPKKEQRGFSLEDSSGNRFTGYYAADKGDSIGTIQSGLSGNTDRFAIFEIPFNPDLEYKLLAENTIINLGKGYGFDIDVGSIVKLAINTGDIKNCDLLEDNTECISIVANKINKHDLCLQASDSMSCAKSLMIKYGVESCNIFSGEENKQCKTEYVRLQEKIHSGEDYSRMMRQCESPGEGGPWHFACHLEIINPNLISKAEMLQLKADNGQTMLCASIGPSGGQDDTRNDDLCIAAEAVYTLNKSQCDKSGTSRASCYYAFALHDPKFSTDDCSVLDDQQIGKCYVNVAARTQDISICTEKSQYGLSEQECTSFVNYYYSWRNNGVYTDVGPDTIFPKYK